MKRYLVNGSGIGNITYHLVMAKDETEARKILAERLGYKSNRWNMQDVSQIEFMTICDFDDTTYEG